MAATLEHMALGDVRGPLAEQRRSAAQTLADLALHDHACVVLDTPGQQLAAGAAFIHAGLARNEQCFYIAEDSRPSQVLEAVAALGSPAEEAVKRGQLAVVRPGDTYLRKGLFDPDDMLGLLRKAAEDAKAAGFSAFRGIGEMAWAAKGPPGVERLIEYESKVNTVFRSCDISAICHYDRRRFSPELMVELLRVHPVVIVGDVVCRNFYYVPPEEYLAGRRAEVEFDRLLENLVAREHQERERLQARERQRELHDLQEVDRARRELLSAAAHELGNPLTPIRLQLTMLRSDLDGVDPKVRERLTVLDRNVDRMGRLVEDLLDVARLQSGRLSLQPAPLDLHHLVQEVGETLRPVALLNRLDLEVRSAAGLEVHADGRRMTQVVFNLLNNAIKYSPPGGKVLLEAKARGGEVVVQVVDKGIGIPPERLGAVFQPFTRLHDDGKRYPGAGLGLFICKSMVEQSGGRIWVQSPGRDLGTTAGFALPRRGLPPAR
jgi:signal transduction histidine kinase